LQNVVTNTTEIFTRLKKVLNIRNDADLARLLSVTPNKLSVWKLRNTVPYEVLILFCREKGLPLEWVLTGESESEQVGRAAPDPYDPIGDKILQMLKDMPDEKRRDVLKYAEEKKLLADLLADDGVKKRGGAA